MEPQPEGGVRRRSLGVERLRDTLRVKAHLASLEARSSWERLETETLNLEREFDRLGAQAGEKLHSALGRVLQALQRFVAAQREEEIGDEATVTRDLMTSPVLTCQPRDTLERAAQLMWDSDCGSLVVVDADGRAIGMITDRDICMAAYTQGKTLGTAFVSGAMSRELVSCSPEETWRTALQRMQAHKVRRLPVLDDQCRPIGVIALADIARHVRARATGFAPTQAQAELGDALAEISDPRPGAALLRSRTAHPIQAGTT